MGKNWWIQSNGFQTTYFNGDRTSTKDCHNNFQTEQYMVTPLTFAIEVMHLFDI